MIFELGRYKLEIDVDRTKAFYLKADKITDGCSCQGCTNYEKWVSSLCADPKYTLEKMGIQMEKAPEVFVNCPNKDGTLFYGGLYHLCGRIIQGDDCWREVDGRGAKALKEDAFVRLADEYQVAFTQDVVLLEKDFPTPVIQMEILANIPWVLTEKCTY